MWGYYKCSREAKDQLQSMTTNVMSSAATSYFRSGSGIMGMFGGSANNAAAGAARV